MIVYLEDIMMRVENTANVQSITHHYDITSLKSKQQQIWKSYSTSIFLSQNPVTSSRSN